MTNVAIKPKLIQELSQVLNMPLTLISGTVGLIKINLPWDKLFSRGKGEPEPLVIELHDLKIHTRLPNELQRVYIYTKKQKLIESFMRKFTERQESQLSFLNKLKIYFFGSITILVKNIELEIGVQMRHSITVSISAQSITFRKDSSSNSTKFDVNALSVGYRSAKETRKEYILREASLDFQANKQKAEWE